jgi:hypothetical protein
MSDLMIRSDFWWHSFSSHARVNSLSRLSQLLFHGRAVRRLSTHLLSLRCRADGHKISFILLCPSDISFTFSFLGGLSYFSYNLGGRSFFHKSLTRPRRLKRSKCWAPPRLDEELMSYLWPDIIFLRPKVSALITHHRSLRFHHLLLGSSEK